MPRKSRFFSSLILVLVAALFSSEPTRGQGIKYTKPLPPRPGTKAAAKPQPTITVSADCQRNYGYCPVQIDYQTPAPTVAEQEVTVQVSFRGRRGRTVVQSEKTFVMPSGSTRATSEVLVPKYTAWHFVNWEVWIDGRREESLCATENYFSVNVGRNQGGPVLLLVSENTRSSSSYFQQRHFDYAGASPVGISFKQLPRQWLGLTGYGVVVFDSASFDKFRDRHPERFESLMNWVRAGGNLWIFHCGEYWSGWDLPEYLQGDASETEVQTRRIDPEKLGWHTVKINNQQEEELHGLVELSDADRRFAEPTVKSVKQAFQDFNAQTSKRIFWARSHGLGTVTAFLPTNRPRDAVAAAWSSLISRRAIWQLRHGNAPGSPNYEFNNFLIPGVGLAPVTQFQLLITLFVLAIGPLNYWLLKRAKKLPWLLVTTPVSAGLLTLFLFGYGLLADGTGVRVRARSVTSLDQAAGEAASWARLSYYAGIAPPGGLTVPCDTALYPINAMMTSASNRYWQRPVVNHEMQWSGDEQKLTDGWLASRSPTQYLSVTSRATTRRLNFVESADGLTVTNNLGADVLSLAVEDLQGESYGCDRLAAGESLTLEKTNRREQATQLRKLVLDNEPIFPPGGEITQRYRNDRLERISDSLLEAEISAAISPLIDGLGRGRYVAITSRGLEVEIGVEDAEEESSFHVLKGRYAIASKSEADGTAEDQP